MQISARERNILIIAGLVAAAFVATRIFPAVQGIYDRRSQAIESINLQIEREQRLFDESATWSNRRAEIESAEEQLESQVFSGQTLPIIEANIQRALTLQARDNQISVTSTRLAERLDAGGWVLISQEMSFRTGDASNTINFLQSLAESTPRLWVTDFSLDRARNQFSGSITVVGFAKSEGLLVAQARSR